jgi:hypothetical protein
MQKMNTLTDTASAKAHPPFTGAWQPESAAARNALATALREVEVYEERQRQEPASDGTKRRRRQRPAQLKFETATRAILCEAMVAAVSEIDHGFRCPRSKGVLEKTDRSRSPAINPLLPQVLDVLEALGFIAQAIGYVSSDGERHQTVVRPAAALDQLCQAFELTVDDFVREDPGDEIILRVVKAEGSERARNIDYVETGLTRQMRAEMQAINAHLRYADIEVMDGAVDGFRRKLRRIFSNGSFESGGRLYSGFWLEGLKAEERLRSIRIDRQPIVELDYGQCALRILYGIAGAQPPKGDLYAVPGLAHADRDDVKTLLASLTFVDETQVRDLAPLARKLCPDIRPPIDGDLEHLANAAALDRVLDCVRRHHAPVASFFPSTIGHRVQRIESDIMVRLLLTLNGKGITALPIHDAVLVRHDRAGQARAIMAEVFEAIAHVSAIIRETR